MKRAIILSVAALLAAQAQASKVTCDYQEQPCDQKGDHYSCIIEIFTPDNTFCSATDVSNNGSIEQSDDSGAHPKCPDDYYGVYAITPNDYVAIGTSETNEMDINFGSNECIAAVNGLPGVTNPEANASAKHVSCSMSCESNGILDLNVDGTQHNFFKNGTDLVVDGKEKLRKVGDLRMEA